MSEIQINGTEQVPDFLRIVVIVHRKPAVHLSDVMYQAKL